MWKIFAVDDDTEMLEMMSFMLSPLGCSMASATRCKGAVDKMRQFVPDVILLDVMLPDGSGYEISRSVRADPTLYKTPILFISAIADGPEVEYALSQGCDAYLHKPFSAMDLAMRLRDMGALMIRIDRPSAETNLMTLEAITREIDHRVFQQRAFALCYAAIENFDSYQFNHGPEEAAKLIVRTGRMIRQTVQDLDFHGVAVAHLGREHFLALLPPSGYAAFCTRLDAGVDGAGARRMPLRMDVAVHNESFSVDTHELLHELRGSHAKPEGGCQKTLFRWNLHRDW